MSKPVEEIRKEMVGNVENEACVVCGSTTDVFKYDSVRGGWICDKCVDKDREAWFKAFG